jgi:hypothetical protein
VLAGCRSTMRATSSRKPSYPAEPSGRAMLISDINLTFSTIPFVGLPHQALASLPEGLT